MLALYGNADAAVPDSPVVYLADYGARSNSFENASPAVVKALEACRGKRQPTLVLPGGRIDLWPDGAFKKELYISNDTESDSASKVKNIGFLLDSMEGLTIEGHNTLVVLHGKMISFALINSRKITLRNIAFDYERPTMSEATVASVSDSAAVLAVHPDSRYQVRNGQVTFYGEGWKSNRLHAIRFNPATSFMHYSSFQPFLKAGASELAPFQLAFAGDFSKRDFSKGDILTFRDPYRDNSGGFIWLSKNIRLEGVQMHYMHGLGIVSQFSENISFRRVSVKPRETSGRVIAAFADAFHFSGCKGTIVIDSCETSGLHDDPVNVHGTHLKITEQTDDTHVKLQFMHHQTYGFPAFFSGDSVALIDPETLQEVGYARVRNATLVNKKEMVVEMDRPIPGTIRPGLCMENLTWTPSVEIRNSLFERTNTRGMLITTRKKVVIEHNVFKRTGMHAILIADDAASWYESGPVRDVTIRNNTFESCGYNQAPGSYVIAILPENHKKVPGYYVHRNISITGNVFTIFDAPVLIAKSVDGLMVHSNTIKKADRLNGLQKRPAFELRDCRNISIKKNTTDVPWPVRVHLANTDRSAVQTDLNIVTP
ncbi:right-handed parallel beta-helix repeat-containing protein [Niabella sp. CC-SYL272]|uniref:right-handed parallel beta-helix repeat-containing protein n=1 Tax=Niabella agricola TaxID=2891571 RepID=UPI001F432ABE|nr:right-handed parallel beta-helix repeat-containing protein [Niabella agricola]MCF3107361.1 right-handed parallel beta-helix repeat-containing protein [Niabella agricola]